MPPEEAAAAGEQIHERRHEAARVTSAGCEARALPVRRARAAFYMRAGGGDSCCQLLVFFNRLVELH